MTVAYADLPAAMIGHLRDQPTIVAAFGEDTSAPATTKLWGDEVRAGVAMPWAVYEEIDRKTTDMTAAGGVVNRLNDLTIRWTVVGEGKQAVRQLAEMLIDGLNDAPLLFEGGKLMYFRSTSGPIFVPNQGIAPSTPSAYVAVVVFSAMVSSTLL